jgi:WD40 repeat protein
VTLVPAHRAPGMAWVAWGGVGCAAALLCACPQMLDDRFGVTVPDARPAGAGGDAAGAGGALQGGASGMGGAGVGGDAAGGGGVGGGGTGGGGRGETGGSSGSLPPSIDAGPTGGTGSGQLEDRETVIAWDGVDDAAACRFGAPELLSGLALGGSEWGPAPNPNALTLLLASDAPGNEDLFEASRSSRGTTFTSATPLSTMNTASNEGSPFLAASNLALYFYSDRLGGVGGRDIYVAKRLLPVGSFLNPSPVANVNDVAMDHLPRLSADERTLVFTSTRAGGQGGADLWVATRSSTLFSFGTPVPIAGVNSAANEESGNLSADGLSIVFDSTRAGGLGGHDLWLATRSDDAAPFGEAVNLAGLNTSADEVNVLMSEDGNELFFSSNRGDGSTYQVWRGLRRCD